MFGWGKKPTGWKQLRPPTWQVETSLPVEKMNAALDAAIRLFTHALKQAGQDCGGLALDGPAPPAVASLLAESVTYPSENGSEFLTLGLSLDFKAFSYQPHCRLFLIINAALILEQLRDSPLRSDVAMGQVPRQLVDAHMMKIWIKYIRPTANAIADKDKNILATILRPLISETKNLRQLVPSWIAQRVNVEECSREWCSGFPATIGRPLTADVKRINKLPVTEFVGKLITDFLAEAQMEGLRERLK
jgi:hypothetical protein